MVGRERLGPFDVARLTATDPAALRNWLKANGFQLPASLAAELRPYVAQRWEYVAIRLAPAGADRRLTGTLDPLRLSFASDRLVYPMRLSRLAKTPQSLGLYVLAAHRMEPRGAIGGARPEVFFAGRIHPEGALRDLDGTDDGKGTDGGKGTSGTNGRKGSNGRKGTGSTFLTAIDQSFPQPQHITGDHELLRAPEDTAFRRITYTYSLLVVGGVPVWVLTVGGTLLLLAAAAALVIGLHRRRPVTPPAAVQVPPPLP